MGTVLLPTISGLTGRFILQRSYVYGFAANWPTGCAESVSGSLWTLTLPASFPPYVKTMRLDAPFYTWNSNQRTFDFIWEDFYTYDPTILGPVMPEPFTLRLHTRPGTRHQYLFMDVGFWTTIYYREIPLAPSGWWTPPL